MSFRVGAGRRRRSWLIVEWMKKTGLTNEAVARTAGVKASTVSHTIHGRRNNRNVLGVLQAQGCPLGLLSLPDDMVEAA